MIRPMAERDIPGAAALERQLFSVPWSERSLRESLKKPEYLFFVAEEQGQVVGYAGLLQNLDEGDILNVAVAPAWRGKGLGRALMKALMDEGRERGLQAFTLEVRAGNVPAIHLYGSLGFSAAGVRKGFYELPREDALIMWWKMPDC